MESLHIVRLESAAEQVPMRTITFASPDQVRCASTQSLADAGPVSRTFTESSVVKESTVPASCPETSRLEFRAEDFPAQGLDGDAYSRPLPKPRQWSR